MPPLNSIWNDRVIENTVFISGLRKHLFDLLIPAKPCSLPPTILATAQELETNYRHCDFARTYAVGNFSKNHQDSNPRVALIGQYLWKLILVLLKNIMLHLIIKILLQNAIMIIQGEILHLFKKFNLCAICLIVSMKKILMKTRMFSIQSMICLMIKSNVPISFPNLQL